MLNRLLSILILASLALTSQARANPEPPANYDARVAAMAGVGVATTLNATGLFHNPAQLENVERLSVSMVLSSLLVNFEAPFAGAGSEVDSGIIYAPLMFVGGAFRLTDRVVTGVGAYVYTGFGGGFPNVDCLSFSGASACSDPDFSGRFEPSAQEVTLFIAELAIPIQFTVSDWLSLGFSLRLPWGRQQVVAHQDVANSNPDELFIGQAEQKLSGFGPPGFLLGVSLHPSPNWTIGLTYRTSTWVDMSGQTTVPPLFDGADAIVIDTRSRWNTPNMFRLGVAYRGRNERLTVSGELRIQLHGQSNREQVFELDSILAPNTRALFNWRDVFVGALGGEYWLTRGFALRAGGSVGNSATPPETITPFSPPPGIQFGAYGGFGIRAGIVDIDVAGGWGGGPAFVQESNGALCTDADSRTEGRGRNQTLTASGGCAGSYKVDSFVISVSASINLDRQVPEGVQVPE